jgi:type III restriction enzyme
LRFNKLREELKINSITEILEDKLLGQFTIKLIVPKMIDSLENVTNIDQLNALIRFFEKVAFEIQAISNPFIGSAFELKPFAEMDVWYKEKSIIAEPENIDLENELKGKEWYIYNGFSGTSEERNLISFLNDTVGNFENKYEKVFLLRNEEVYKIYDFEKGRGFQPDFLLFLKSQNKELYYQVFIEPKGGDRISNDDSKWKEEFLNQISKKYGSNEILKQENKDYALFGLPLYNSQNDFDFKKAVNKYLVVEI